MTCSPPLDYAFLTSLTQSCQKAENSTSGNAATASFSYTDNDGTDFTNSIETRPISVPVALDSISKDSSYNLVWTGNPIATDEAVYVIVNETGEINGTLFSQLNVGATSKILP